MQMTAGLDPGSPAPPPPAAPLSGAIAAEACAAPAQGHARVRRIAVSGQVCRVKSAEHLTLRMRLQKGNAQSAFAPERAALATLAPAGAPVPPVVAEGPGVFVTPDSGTPLRDLLRDPGPAPGDRTHPFAGAARALAGLHARGFGHGRPAIKDVCRNGRRATFLDLERYKPSRNSHRGHVEDLLMLVFSSFVETRGPAPETEALARAYRAADPGGVWAGAERLCRRLRWLAPLGWPVRRWRAAPEFLANPPTLAAINAG